MNAGAPLASGDSILHFKLEELVAETRSGSTWKALDDKNQQSVSLKILSAALFEDPGRRQQTFQRIKAVAGVRTPSVAGLRGFEQGQDRFVVVMDWVDSAPLAAIVEIDPFETPAFLVEAIKLAETVEAFRSAGFPDLRIHADEIRLTPLRQLKFIGLGLGDNLFSFEGKMPQAPETAQGAVYLSPEQILGKGSDERSLVFFLGALFYQLLTGHVPFEGTSAEEVLRKIVRDPPASPHSHKKGLDPRLISVLARTLHKDPARRIPQLTTLIEELKTIQAGGAEAAKTPVLQPAPIAPPIARSITKPETKPQAPVPPPPPPVARPPVPPPPMPAVAAPPAPARDAPARPAGPSARALTDAPPQPQAQPQPKASPPRPPTDAPQQPRTSPAAGSATPAAISSKPPAPPSPATRPVEEPRRRDEPAPGLAADREPDSVVMVADLPEFPAMARTNIELASKVAAKMQQVLSEAVFLFDGKIVDPFGPRVVAQIDTVDLALKVFAKAREDVKDYNRSAPKDSVLRIRYVVHSGPIRLTRSEISGPAVETALEASQTAPVGQLVISRTAVDALGWTAPAKAFGTFGGVEFLEGIPEKPKPVIVAPPVVMEELTTAPGPPARKRLPFVAIGAGVAALLVIVLAVVLMGRSRANRDEAARKAGAGARRNPAMAVAPAAVRVRVAIDPFTSQTPDPAVAKELDRLQLLIRQLLLSVPSIEVGSSAGTEARIAGMVRPGVSGLEVVPLFTQGTETTEGPAFPFRSALGSLPDLTQWLRLQLRLQRPLVSEVPAANEKFAEASTLWRDRHKADAAIENAIRDSLTADPGFRAMHNLAFEYFDATENAAGAAEAGQFLLQEDPDNVVLLRKVARYRTQSGRPAEAVANWKRLLAKAPADREALLAMGGAALSAGQSGAFQKILRQLGKDSPFHAPDLLLSEGRIDAAAAQYFDLETANPASPSLALKIGTVSVLRRSMPIAELELRKLEQSDRVYGRPLLRAYMFAQSGARDEAMREWATASLGMKPGQDAPFTALAEIEAILGNPDALLEALQKAVSRGEPALNYILNSPLFRFLNSDPRFQEIRTAAETEKKAIAEQFRGF